MEIDQALYETALSIGDLSARRAFLSKACVDDATRLARVESWLNEKDAADDFFRAATRALTVIVEEATEALMPSLVASEIASSAEGPGTRIGCYTLLERIGEGGCGVVYLADQSEPLRRRVALKVIRLGLDTEKVVARFEMERQALALMDHPNIARVLDAGATDSGRPYFVMELVHGVRITEHCDTQRMGVRQRLELFIRVCQAIQHAHQKGVIHRDIKPSNILVSSQDGLAVPKVIDFGIGRAVEGRLTGETSMTGRDQLIGTPAYMSPEQAEGGADTRSDVYSLGVLLCELLTGETPFNGKRLAEAGLFEMLRILKEEEPAAPSAILARLDPKKLATVATRRGVEPRQLIGDVRGDLEWIVLKTLAKDRSFRYPTVNGLASDLQRLLNDEPVLARPPGRIYLFGKLVRRNKAIFVSSAAVALALVLGLVASSWFYLREREGRRVQLRLFQAAETARANEARLLRQSKARESISQAAILLAEGKIEEADALLLKTPLTSIEPSLEAANLFRTLGDWNAIQQRSRQAAECYSLFLQVNLQQTFPRDPMFMISIGPTLVEAGNLNEYQRCREAAFTNLGKIRDLAQTAVLLKACLLAPAEETLLQRLQPTADTLVSTLSNEDQMRAFGAYQSAFAAMSLGMMEYRRGNFAQALDWNRRCEAFADKNQARSVTVHAVSAMAAYRLGQPALALTELAQAREIFVGPFAKAATPRGQGQGVWQDWAIARVLLREAVALVDAPSTTRR